MSANAEVDEKPIDPTAPCALPTQASQEHKSHFESTKFLDVMEEVVQHVAYTQSPFPSIAVRVKANEIEFRRRQTAVSDTVAQLSKTNAWRSLQKEFEHICKKSISEFFVDDAERFKKFSAKVELPGDTDCSDNFLFLDYSKSHITEDIRKKLVELAVATKVCERRDAMWAGEEINSTEKRPVLHVALRNINGESKFPCQGRPDVTVDVKNVLKRIQAFTDKVLSGEWKGHSGKAIKNIVNIGIGGSDLGPMLACEALTPYATALNIQHVANVDGSAIVDALKNVDLEETIFVVCSKTFTTQETLRNASTAKTALVKHYASKNDAAAETAVAKHFVAVSTNAVEVKKFGIDESNMFAFWEFVGGRYSMWSAIGVSIALRIGFKNFQEMLEGAQQMDVHFKDTELSQSLPVMLGLVGIWYNNFFDAAAHAVLPYSQHLRKLPAYLQQLDMESNGKVVRQDQQDTACDTATGPIVFGDAGTNSQHAFFQLLHQGSRLVTSDFIGALQSHNPTEGDVHHKLLMANMFAQSEALMVGKSRNAVRNDLADARLGKAEIEQLVAHKTFPGNRPSNTLLVKKLTPRAFGALIAAYEHKVFVQGAVWGINSFDQWGVELGKVLAGNLIPQMFPGSIVSTHDGSTNGLVNMFNDTLAKPQ